jgi:putative glutamine amidotransferase
MSRRWSPTLIEAGSPGPEFPLIGITTYRQPADWGTWQRIPADLLPASYARSVSAAGGVPVLIPPVRTASEADALAARLDGLIIAGGADVNPERYGQAPDPTVTAWGDDRDASELWLLDAASERALPVLGICRGMQLMAVHAGGSLIQHLPHRVGHARHSGGVNTYGELAVTVTAGHRVSQLVSKDLVVACHHHQAVGTHPGFIATAHADDGVLEAMEAEGDRFAVGVQWHPETEADCGLFAGLVDAARRSKASSCCLMSIPPGRLIRCLI